MLASKNMRRDIVQCFSKVSDSEFEVLDWEVQIFDRQHVFLEPFFANVWTSPELIPKQPVN